MMHGPINIRFTAARFKVSLTVSLAVTVCGLDA